MDRWQRVQVTAEARPIATTTNHTYTSIDRALVTDLPGCRVYFFSYGAPTPDDPTNIFWPSAVVMSFALAVREPSFA